jgi:hypothetical protein
MDTNACNCVVEQLTSENKWSSPSIKVMFASGLRDDTPQEIDLTSTIGQARYQSKERYWLPSTFNENTKDFRTKILIPIFVLACKDAGFKLASKGWQGTKKSHVNFRCHRGFLYDGIFSPEVRSTSLYNMINDMIFSIHLFCLSLIYLNTLLLCPDNIHRRQRGEILARSVHAIKMTYAHSFLMCIGILTAAGGMYPNDVLVIPTMLVIHPKKPTVLLYLLYLPRKEMLMQ